MKKNDIFSITLVGVLLFAAQMNGAVAQNGTYDYPYPIKDAAALYAFAQCINSGQNFSYRYTDSMFVLDPNGPIPAYGEGTYFKQMANIDLAGKTWHPIGTSPTTGFRGNYDGDVYNIINLKLTANQPALFCYSTGTIGHLTMQDPVFADNVNNSGALATYVMGGTIRDCHVNCSPGSPLVFNGKNCGALIGCIGIPDGQKADDVTIDRCSSNCEIISNYQQTSANDQNSVAGVVAVINAHHYLVTRCYNFGNISSTYRPKFQEDTLSVAGVVGRGLVPTTPSLISRCYNKGHITAHCGYIGGVAGLFDAESGLSNNTRCNIDSCFNTGRITGVGVLYSSDTMPSNYYSLSPQLRPAADSNLNILSVGGVLAPCKAKTRYSFNTGIITLTKHPHPKFNIKGDQGVVGLGSIAEHCFNVGEIYNYETRNGRAAGVASDTARYCINAVAIYDRNLTYSYLPRSISNNYSINCIADAQMAPDGLDGILFPSVNIFGGDPTIMDILGDEHWVFGTNVYPQLKWTQEGGEGEDAKDFAIAASEPIFLSDIDIYHVKNPFRLGCFYTKLYWQVPKHNCLVTIDNQSCSGGFIWPTVDTVSECDMIVPVTAILSSDDTIKVTHLLHSITPPSDILTVDNLNELKMLRDSVNSGKSFSYKNHKLPRYAEGVTFKLTTDLNMGYQRPWEPIGSVMSGSRFAGRFLGDGHTIYNLSLDNATPNRDKNANFGGLFGMLSGEVRDLIFENLTADSTTIVAGAVCALMNGATIENCIVKGHIETSKSNNYYALSGIGGIAGVSLTARIQDSIFQCGDTIRGCINYADITTHVGRGKNIAFHSVGGIIGHGGVVIDCANAGNISASKDCGYLGGIGGDLTSALRCFNTGRINIEEANQTGNFYVGGVVGLNEADSAVRYCYNAGPIQGSDRNYVGGIIGKGNPKYCYTSNTTICRGAHTGSIVGISEHDQNCYYDKQMSPMAANNGSNIPARSVKGFETTAMLGSALSDSLGDNTNWIFTPGLYPQLAGTRNDADLQRVAVMPVVLGSGQNWATAHDSIPLKGCDDHYFWKKISGNVSVNDCNVHTSNRDKGTMEFAATLDSVPYRYITLKFNLEESHAYVITSLRQFDTMRMVINQGGYYNLIDSTFHLTIPAGANANDFIAIMDGGKDCYFKLTASEIDIEVLRWSDNSQKHWTPIGGYADNTCGFEGRTFKGIFDGNGCTVKRLQFEGCNNPRIGLFGVIEGGTVKNLILDNPKGDIHYDTIGFLCSINKGGTIYNCEVVNSVWEFDTLVYTSSNIGFLCGKNEEGIIDSCRIKNARMLRLPGAINTYNRHNVGGVCALNDRGVISRCRVEDFRYEDCSDFYTIVENLGGICGKNYHGQLLSDTIARSRFLLRVAKQYKNVGGICGLSGYSSDDADKEASYGYMPSVIDGCVSDGFTFTADTCNGYGDCIKNIRHVGGIVGMCQGQNITLTNCHNLAGKISVCADSVGGICGRFTGEGGDSYIRNCSNHVNVTGSSYVGGVVGIISGANIYDSQNDGTIRAAAGPRYWPAAGYYAGGIAGALTGKSGLITCHNSGLAGTDSNYVGGMAGAMLENSSLHLCTNNGTVRGRDQVGGLAGLVCQNAWFDSCSVLGEGKVSGIAQVGGLVGYLKGVGAHTCRNSRNDVQKIFYAGMGGGVYGYAEDPTMLENCSSTNIVRYDAVMDISSIDELLYFRQHVNNGNTYEGTLVRLNSNLEITSDWEPIGKNPEQPFRGIFDGLDHSIKYTINVNYPYNYDDEDYYYQGLFGYMEGTVRNLDLVDCSISADNSDYVGLVAGYCHGSILDCGSYAHSDSPKVKGRNYVGGLVGMAYNSEIKNCYNGLNVSGKQYVGGIVGDFTAGKNIATYGAVPYNLYGGNVNQCFNYGMIQSRITYNCYAGGIAGSTSAEIKHCYNSGSVNGSHRAGGIAGQLLGDSIHHCYNTGYLPYGSLQMAIVSDCGPTNGYSVYDCFYDRQMCTAEEVNATGLFTSEMVAGTNPYSSIRAALGDEYWTYNNNEYPSLTRFYPKAGIIVPISVKPLLLPGYMPVDNIMVNFSGATGNNSCDQDTRVVWSRYNTSAAAAVDMGDCMPYKDSILINSVGYDTLRVSYNQPLGAQRLVPVRVRNVPENYYVSNVTAFNSYTWPVNSTTYGKSGFYTYIKHEQSYGIERIIYYALNLTIVNVDCRIEQVKGTCGTIADGALLSTVSGGTGNGFRYKWTNAGNDSLGNLPNLANILPGTYHLTLTDSLISTCVLTQTVTLGEPEPVNLTISGCSESKDYDGTPFTVYRYVVQEEGYAPDTLNAGQCAILSNGDTLHVSLSNPVNISNPFDSPEGVSIISYSITNGIDHRCHYHVTLEAGSVTINKRPVTITVNDASKTSGEDDPVFSGTVTGLVHDNDLGTISFYRTDATQPDVVGTYVDVLTATYTSNTNYVVTVKNGTFTINCKHTLLSITNWPDTTTVPGVCFDPTNTDLLPSDSAFQAMYQWHVTHTDSVLRSDPCDWLCARTYTSTWNPIDYNANCRLESRVMYITGGDTTGPKLTIDTLKVDACRFKGDIDDIIPDKQVLIFEDCSGVAAISYTQDTTVNDPGWTVRRIYELRDFCGNLNFDTLYICGVDTIPPRPDPRAFPQRVVNDTLWADPVCRCDTNPALFIQITDNPHRVVRRFDLIDNCDEYDENGPYSLIVLSAEKTVKNGGNCVDTAVISYVVSDRAGNRATYYHAQLITDTTPPTFDIVPKDTTLCLLGPGLYEETVNSAIYDEHNQVINRVANIHDNCTKLQGSFVVHDSIDLDNYTVVNGIRQYEQYWTVTDSCGNSFTDKMIIKVNPLPTIRIDTLGTQTITYGEQFQDITIKNEYSVVSLTPSDRGLVYSEGKVTGWLDSAGTYSYTATATSNQTPGCGSVDTVITIQVEPRPITIAAGSATKKYDGTPLTSPYYECTVIDYDNMHNWIPILNTDSIAGLTITGSQTDVGSSANVPSNAVITRRTDATVNMNSSYAVTYANGALTVTTNDTLIKVIPADGTKVYDGTPLTKTAHEDFTVTGVPEGLTWTATADGTVTNVIPGEGEKAVNAVTSFHIFDADGHDVTAFFTNIEDSIGTLTITPKPLTITACDSTKVYDGTYLMQKRYTHTPLAPGDSIYKVSFISRRKPAGSVANVPQNALIKNAAGKSVISNYAVTYVNGTLTVTPKPMTITAGSDTKVYDGSFLTNNTYTYTQNDLVAGDSLWSVTITGKQALVGESCNVPSAAVIKNASNQNMTSNYDIIYVNGTLTVTPRPLTITAGDSTKVYDGTPLTQPGYSHTDLVTGDSIWSVTVESSLWKAGTCDNVPSAANIQNASSVDVSSCYDITFVNGTLEVTPKPLNVTAGDTTKLYDGTPLTGGSFTHTALVPGDTVWSVLFDGSQTEVGTGSVVPTGVVIKSANHGDADVSDCYQVTYLPGTLTVMQGVVILEGGWQAIAAPVHDDGETCWTIAAALITGSYDFFRYDEPTATWQNQKNDGFNRMDLGRGYIYRRNDDLAIPFGGNFNSGDVQITLTASGSGDLRGFNLVGNPFPHSVTLCLPFYSLNADGSWTAHAAGDAVAMGQGILVYTDHPTTLLFHDHQGCTVDPAKGTLPPLPKGLCLNENDNDNDNDNLNVNGDFARWEGDHLVITGEGILQAYDIMGRLLLSRKMKNEELRMKNSEFPGTGVYVLRLNGQTQKIVIK